MSRRRKQSPAEDLFDLAAGIPPWAGIVSSVIVYLVLHTLAVADVARSSFSVAVLKTFANVGQYLIPLVILLGALSSGARVLLNGRDEAASPGSRTRGRRREPRLPPSFGGPDLEAISEGPGRERRDQPRPERLNVELLNRIDRKRFEELCAEYFRLCGFGATTRRRGPDGGIDIRLYAPGDGSEPVNLVQCKQRRRGKIGPKPLRELLGVMTAGKFARGTFVTSSTFNDAAERFAGANGIYLVDGAALVERIRQRPERDQQALLDVACRGDYLTPTCPSCGTKLVERRNARDESRFRGCVSCPSCAYTMKMTAPGAS